MSSSSSWAGQSLDIVEQPPCVCLNDIPLIFRVPGEAGRVGEIHHSQRPQHVCCISCTVLAEDVPSAAYRHRKRTCMSACFAHFSSLRYTYSLVEATTFSNQLHPVRLYGSLGNRQCRRQCGTSVGPLPDRQDAGGPWTGNEICRSERQSVDCITCSLCHRSTAIVI